MEIQWAESPNKWQGRNGKKIIAIVNHITAGLMPGTLSWMRNPNSKASAHYLVTRVGEIFQMVADEDSAYHAGAVAKPSWPLYDGTNPNRYTLGIEHEGYPDEPLTEEQYQATLWLHKQLIAKWGIPVGPDTIIGHYRIDSVNRPNCPGPMFPWDRLFADLGQPNYPAVNIVVGGQVLKGFIIAIDGKDRSCAPVAVLAQALGGQAQWDASTNTVLIAPYTGPAYRYTPYVKIVVGNQIIPAVIINGRSYAPVAAVVMAMGHSVRWEAESNTVVVG